MDARAASDRRCLTVSLPTHCLLLTGDEKESVFAKFRTNNDLPKGHDRTLNIAYSISRFQVDEGDPMEDGQYAGPCDRTARMVPTPPTGRDGGSG